MKESFRCWHFAGDTLRDGSPLPGEGVALPEIENIEPCVRGYHGATRAIDALRYAPGAWVARVKLTGTIVEHGDPVDKICASKRVGLTDYINCEDLLRSFACQCALDVAHLWDMPEIVREYLTTQDPEIRDVARATAWDSAWDSAGDAAWEAAWEAARDAAWTAAGAATWDAAWAAAGDVARAAAWAAQNDRLETMLREALEDL